MPQLVTNGTNGHINAKAAFAAVTPAVIEAADHLRVFEHHGVDLSNGDEQRNGDCPFCGKAKFSVQADSGLWKCWVCSRSGNPLEFVRTLHTASVAATDAGWYRKLADDRKLLYWETPRDWGASRSVIDGTWQIAGYNVKGELTQLYRRIQVQSSNGKWAWVLMPTPGLWPERKAHGLHMVGAEWDSNKLNTYITEGPWDGMALWEVAKQAKRVNRPLEYAVSGAQSILADTNVIAVPGCGSWQDTWTDACRGKVVTLMYDNDHPREHNGVTTMAGYDAMKRVTGLLAKAAKEVRCIVWGMSGFDSSLSNGCDVRDMLSGV